MKHIYISIYLRFMRTDAGLWEVEAGSWATEDVPGVADKSRLTETKKSKG